MGFDRELGELNFFRSLAKGPFERRVDDDVFEINFPLNFEGIVKVELVGHFGPTQMRALT